MAAEMRRRLIDHARRRLASKRGGGAIHEPISTSAGIPARAEADDIEGMLARLDKAPHRAEHHLSQGGPRRPAPVPCGADDRRSGPRN